MYFKPRLDISESPMEYELNHQLLRFGARGEKQYQVGRYFIDIAFPKIKLAIEYDGECHKRKEEYDKIREDYLKSQGWGVIHVNKTHDLESKAKEIAEEIYFSDSQNMQDWVLGKKTPFWLEPNYLYD